MRSIAFFLLFFIFNTTFAQHANTMTDEEYAILRHKIRQNFNANTDSSLVYANQMAKSNNNKHLAFANAALSVLWQNKGKTELSREKYKKALYYLDKVPDSQDKIQLKSYIYNYGGLAEFDRRNFSAALEKFHQGIKLSQQIGDINQMVNFKANIVLANEVIGNYQLAIKNGRELDRFLHENKDLFDKESFLNKKSNINLSLGGSYEDYFKANKNKKYLLDSAAYFYKKTIDYSDNYLFNKITAKLNLGNVYNWKGNIKDAEKIYYQVVLLCEENDQKELLCTANFNLGDIYYTLKKYDKALFFYKNTDSLALLSNSNELDYLKSNYYQSKVYALLKKPELAYRHSVIYLNSKRKYDAKLKKEKLAVNELQGIGNLTKEMVSVERNYKKDMLLNKSLKGFYIFLIIGIITLLVKSNRDKNKANKNMSALIQELKANIEKENNAFAKVKLLESEKVELKTESSSLSIDLAKENEIVEKLLDLENNLEYLNKDFTLAYVAKKIKTNTTYLSYVVNKRFGKSFGEYTNELKINYAINKMITSETYRKKSTQATAESVGFKNAGSFAKSFRKRTGVSPAQFANNI
ncbi:AraC family transcriptional regulator [Flavobacterium pectinovorum]|uniref:AraC family transcriptional regulator n=1 Tax=Flavobacterium pectinovorum TaxID=29533 RepID=A0A502F5U7_9FLAO|nr:AraC family transcriptional regulator [Flavobacterium pectinovorum]TPG44330.1 AraC family transcriptional regulator [Flavobacterium pectinovorum]